MQPEFSVVGDDIVMSGDVVATIKPDLRPSLRGVLEGTLEAISGNVTADGDGHAYLHASDDDDD